MANILVVDDCPFSREQVAGSLRRAHRVLRASTGPEALALARRKSPDAVVGNLLLWVTRNRVRLVQALRSDRKLRDIPRLQCAGAEWTQVLPAAQKYRLTTIVNPARQPDALRAEVLRLLRYRPNSRNGWHFNGSQRAALHAGRNGKPSAATDSSQADKQRIAQLSRQIVRAHEEERRRIATLLHDDVGQLLTAINVNVQCLKPSLHTPEAQSTWHETMVLIRQTLEDVRSLSRQLRPCMLELLGLEGAIRSYTARHAERSGFAADVSIQPIPRGAVAPEIETTCFRIVQEAVTNIIRHACAGKVTIELRSDSSHVWLTVADDGVGFDVSAARRLASQGQSAGLVSLDERVSLLGGRFSIDSALARGTTVRVELPLEDEPVPRNGAP
jgi:signal transduction histidine kinase